jgi:hypothetical protein
MRMYIDNFTVFGFGQVRRAVVGCLRKHIVLMSLPEQSRQIGFSLAQVSVRLTSGDAKLARRLLHRVMLNIVQK